MPRKQPEPAPAPPVVALVPKSAAKKGARPLCSCGNGLPVESDGQCMDCRVEDWSPSYLLSVKHLGPGLIGKALYKASQAYVGTTSEGLFGPALLGIVPPGYEDQTPKKDLPPAA